MRAGAVISIDGLMCVGKTKLLYRLNEALPNSQYLPEIVSVRRDNETDREFFERNDLEKLSIIDTSTSLHVLADRSFLSTFAYALSFEGTKLSVDDLYGKVSISKLPDIVVYMREDPARSLERAQSMGRFLDGQWRDLDALVRMSAAYESLFADLPCRFPESNVAVVESDVYYQDPVAQESWLLNEIHGRVSGRR